MVDNSALYIGGGRWIRPRAGGPFRGSDAPPARHSLPLPFESTTAKENPSRAERHTSDFGGGRWIRTTEVEDNRFTVCPLWPLGNSPIFNLPPFKSRRNSETWSRWTDSLFCGKATAVATVPRTVAKSRLSSPAETPKFGAGGRTRTPDLLITNQLLYQLSYTGARLSALNGKGHCSK